MKQEALFVAETYRLAYPHIDVEKPLYLGVDGAAAHSAAKSGAFLDGTIPDLWFTVRGRTEKTLVEAKSVGEGRRVLLMRGQLTKWRSGGGGAHRPDYWIAAEGGMSRFFLWSHAEFLPSLDGCSNSQRTASVRIPRSSAEFLTVGEMVESLVRRVLAGESAKA